MHNIKSINQDTLDAIEGLLIFDIGNKVFCADTINLDAIIKLNDVKFNYKNKFKDEVYYEGQSFRIIDINETLKIPVTHFTNNSRIILFETLGKMFGFIVDKIIEIVTTDSIFRKKYLKMKPAINEKYICGELSLQKRNIFLLDLEQLSCELKTIKKYYLKMSSFN